MSVYCPRLKHNTVYLTCQECTDKVCKDGTFYCLVVGSREFTDYNRMEQALDKVLTNYISSVCIVSGGVCGAGLLAKEYAAKKGYRYKEIPDERDKDGKQAGMIHNTRRFDYISMYKNKGVVAFWDGRSRDTKHDIELAEKYNIQIRVYNVKKSE